MFRLGQVASFIALSAVYFLHLPICIAEQTSNLETLVIGSKRAGTEIAEKQIERIYELYCSSLIEAYLHSKKEVEKANWLKSLFEQFEARTLATKSLEAMSRAKQWRVKLVAISGQEAVTAVESRLRKPELYKRTDLLAH